MFQSGTTVIGQGLPFGNLDPCKQVHTNFQSAFTDVPKIIATVRGESANKDTFAITTCNIDVNGFIVNVRRLDAGPVSWGQNLQVDWFAWTQE
jgi:hypothetical protein